MTEAGKKFDSNKVRMDLIPPKALLSVGEVMTFGAQKYGDRNWEKGIKFSRLLAATYRHINAYQRGHVRDTESDCFHLAHAIANLMMVIEFGEESEWNDSTSQ